MIILGVLGKKTETKKEKEKKTEIGGGEENQGIEERKEGISRPSL